MIPANPYNNTPLTVRQDTAQTTWNECSKAWAKWFDTNFIVNEVYGSHVIERQFIESEDYEAIKKLAEAQK